MSMKSKVDSWGAFVDPVESLRKSGVLARLMISMPSLAKRDKALTAELAKNKGISSGMAAVNKKLFVWDALDAVVQKANDLRNYHNTNTLRWDVDGARGARFLPLSRVFEYEQMTAKLVNEAHALVDKLMPDYENAVRTAKLALGGSADAGGAWDESDYKSAADFKESFVFKVMVEPIADAESLPEMTSSVATAVSSRIQANLKENFRGVHQQVYDQVKGVLTKLSDTLANEEANRFHETLVTNVAEMATMMKDFNVFGDNKLEELAGDIEVMVAGLTSRDLKDDLEKRREVHKKAKAKLSQLDQRAAALFG